MKYTLHGLIAFQPPPNLMTSTYQIETIDLIAQNPGKRHVEDFEPNEL